MPDISPAQASRAVNAGSKLYELLGAAAQLDSLLSTGKFDRQSPFKGFKGVVSGKDLMAKFTEYKPTLSAIEGSPLEPVKKASAELRKYFAEIEKKLVAELKKSGATFLSGGSDLAGYIKYQEQIVDINTTLSAFKSNKIDPKKEASSYFAGKLDPKEVERRLPVLENETIKWFKGGEGARFGEYQGRIVSAYEEVQRIAKLFVEKGGKLSQKDRDAIRLFPEDPVRGKIGQIRDKQLNTRDLPTEEQSRVLQVPVPEAFKKTQSAILAYNKLLTALGSDTLPSIQSLKKVAHGMSGAAALLSDKLVYKTDLDPSGAQKIASEQEIAAYEKLQGRKAPLLYRSIPGEALVTERIKGRPLKEILDRIAKPVLNLQRQIEEEADQATRAGLEKRLGVEKGRFNKAAAILYEQVGRLGATLQQMGVASDPRGKPLLVFGDALAEHAAREGVLGGHVSLTDERGMVCAMVVLERPDAGGAR